MGEWVGLCVGWAVGGDDGLRAAVGRVRGCVLYNFGGPRCTGHLSRHRPVVEFESNSNG